MTPVEMAVVYLVLAFPGDPHALTVLPMNNEGVCRTEAKEIENHYKGRADPFEVFAHCVVNGPLAR